MKKSKKLLSVLLAVLTVAASLWCFGIGSYAETSGDFTYSVRSDGNVKITKYTGSGETAEIPSSIGGRSVTEIGEKSFYNCNTVKTVVIPQSVKQIDAYAFADCAALSSVSIGEGLETIGDSAFAYLPRLSGIALPDTLYSIGAAAFFGCPSLTSVEIPAETEEIGDLAFGYGYDGNSGQVTEYSSLEIASANGTAAQRYAAENGFAFRCNWFPDVPYGEWYFAAIKYNVKKGYFHGYGTGYFGIADNIQRQDLVVVISKIATADLTPYAGQNGGMSDVPVGEYYSSAVAWAVDKGIISGYQYGGFGVGNPVTREQVCVILYKYIRNYIGADVSVSKSTDELLAPYTDRASVSEWATDAVAWAVDKGIVGNNSATLNPAGNVNRATMAQIIYNMSTGGLI